MSMLRLFNVIVLSEHPTSVTPHAFDLGQPASINAGRTAVLDPAQGKADAPHHKVIQELSAKGTVVVSCHARHD
jgi:hypothetical protein